MGKAEVTVKSLILCVLKFVCFRKMTFTWGLYSYEHDSYVSRQLFSLTSNFTFSRSTKSTKNNWSQVFMITQYLIILSWFSLLLYVWWVLFTQWITTLTVYRIKKATEEIKNTFSFTKEKLESTKKLLSMKLKHQEESLVGMVSMDLYEWT